MPKETLGAFSGLLTANFLQSVGKRKGAVVSRNVSTGDGVFDYQVYLPSGIEKKPNLPLIVFLHGIRERGTGGFVPTTGAAGKFFLQYLKQVPAVILLPQCRQGKYWSDSAMERMVINEIDQTVKEFNVNTEHISLVGVSMGGYGVWHFAVAYPRKFAALVSICGGSPLMHGERFSPIAERIGATPTWVFHGAEDRIVPVSESRQIVEAIQKLGGRVRYNEYENVGHNVWLNALGEKDLLPWILAQQLG